MTTTTATETVSIRPLETHEELVAATALFDRIWGRAPGNSVMPFELLRVFAHCGEYVAGAYQGERLVGAAVGFFSVDRGELHLHSHVAGVDPAAQGRNVGFALKQHQRSFALAHGARAITWTFDPLVRRNAYFNISKLGVTVERYLVDFYGRMGDAINGGDESDRLLVSWRVGDQPPAPPRVPEMTDLEAAGAVVVLSEGPDGSPRDRDGDGDLVIARVPEDIVALRASRPQLALTWRHALRRALGERLDGGIRVLAVTHGGWYVLTL